MTGALCFAAHPWVAVADTPGSTYQIIRSDKVGETGGWDYVYADATHRRLYVPRGDRITVFNLDTLARTDTLSHTASVHGVAIDPASNHAFSSSQPLLMWDATTLATIKSIPVQGSPDGILFEPATERIYVLSHRAPNVTVLDAKDGSIVGTIDLGGAPEQAQSDGAGLVFIDIEDRDQVAVIDAHSLKVLRKYDLNGKGGGPGALALNAKSRTLFVCCHDPATAIMLDADTGAILGVLPIGKGVDAAEFDPDTMECFSSQGDGTLTVIKESEGRHFAVEQTVATKVGARTSTLDQKTGHIFLATADFLPPPSVSAGAPANGGPRRRRATVPGSFTLLEVGQPAPQP
ncbi:MAG TPA: hypothetical protein VGL42_09725 [Opitutaceae bacterium]|jgi:DNA-binding beta-propeller fold protein YncE